MRRGWLYFGIVVGLLHALRGAIEGFDLGMIGCGIGFASAEFELLRYLGSPGKGRQRCILVDEDSVTNMGERNTPEWRAGRRP